MLISSKASNQYTKGYRDRLQETLGFLATYAEGNGWPSVVEVSTELIEGYLLHLQTRPRWFGELTSVQKPLSQSYI